MPAKPHGTQPPTQSGEFGHCSRRSPSATSRWTCLRMQLRQAMQRSRRPKRLSRRQTRMPPREIAKTAPVRTGSANPEIAPVVQPAALKTNEGAAFPPGVSVTIVEPQDVPALPKDGNQAVQATVPLPPEAVGVACLAPGGGERRRESAIRHRQSLRSRRRRCSRCRASCELVWTCGERRARRPLSTDSACSMSEAKASPRIMPRRATGMLRAAEQGNIKAMHNLAVAESGRKDETTELFDGRKVVRRGGSSRSLR